MVAPGGPSDEVWKKMSRKARVVYWICVAIVFSWIGYLFFFK